MAHTTHDTAEGFAGFLDRAVHSAVVYTTGTMALLMAGVGPMVATVERATRAPQFLQAAADLGQTILPHLIR